ncbi:hypothetical protein PsYK624_146390 [Phanerochaete sordida]|uniref:F-box domain-containing protein n=1 Tax=Phanerochaete sordida TaxID=48140 RepID=A0A9P3LL79_9APHY|nr:hypothetical protein PsYK624_146390 [Phanerochaete sordida]
MNLKRDSSVEDTPAHPNQLPTEVVGRIVRAAATDALLKDKITTAHICRYVASIAYPIVFETTTFNASACGACFTAGETFFFLDTATKAGERAIPLVRHLVFTGEIKDEGEKNAYDSHVLLGKVLSICSRFPNLNEVELEHMTCTALPFPQGLFPAAIVLENVTALTVDIYDTRDATKALTSFAQAFPNLDRLHVRTTRIMSAADWVAIEPSLADMEIFPKHLRIGRVTDDRIIYANALIEAASSSVEEITLYLSPTHPQVQGINRETHLSLLGADRLTKLNVIVPFSPIPSGAETKAVTRSLIPMLATRPDALADIVITIFTRPRKLDALVRALSDLPAKAICRALGKGGAAFHSLTFQLNVGVNKAGCAGQDAWEALYERCPMWFPTDMDFAVLYE